MKLGYWPKLKGIKCLETEEKAKQIYDVIQNLREFCRKYKLYEDEINLKWYIEYQLINYKNSNYKEDKYND